MALLLLVLIVGGAWLGYQSSAMLSRANPRVRLADRLWREQQGLVQKTTPESEAFYALGQPNEVVYRQAAQIRKQFDAGSPFFGAWLALVVSLQLISLSMVPSREGYDIDAAACVACGRCFSVCPVGRERAQSLAALEAKV